MAVSSELNSYTEYGYTGNIQTLTIPTNGIYMLEAWGAGGENGTKAGGKGGYAKGYLHLSAGDTLYICVGQRGRSGTAYNGGGDGSSCWAGGGGGAGCTSFAKVTGTVANIGASNKTNIYMIAGGGGGGGKHVAGGAGGGENGESPNNTGIGGTQSSGYQFGNGQAGITSTGSEADASSGGGGGGLYGGKRYQSPQWYWGVGGGGGSGYIGGVPEFTFNNITYTPVNTTGGGANAQNDGYAKVTLVALDFPPIIFNETTLTGLEFNSTSVTEVYFNGTKVGS